MERISSRKVLFATIGLALVLMLADHLMSPPLNASSMDGPAACAPCGAPCPSTR